MTPKMIKMVPPSYADLKVDGRPIKDGELVEISAVQVSGHERKGWKVAETKTTKTTKPTNPRKPRGDAPATGDQE